MRSKSFHHGLFLCFAAIGVGVATALFTPSERLILTFEVCILGLLVFVPWVPVLIGHKRLDIFEPIYVVGSTYFIYFGVRLLFIVLDNPALQTSRFNLLPYVPVPSASEMIIPELYAVAGFASFVAGYYSGIPQWLGRKLPRLRCSWTRKRELAGFFGLLLIGLSFTILNVVRGRLYGSVSLTQLGINLAYQGLIDTLAGFMRIAFILAATYMFAYPGAKTVSSFMVLLFVPLQLALALIIGSKQEIVYTLLFLIVPYHYLKRRLTSFQLFLFIIAGLATFPLIAVYYDVIHTSSRVAFTPEYALVDIGNTAEKLFHIAKTGQLLPLTIEYFIGRFNGIDTLTLIMSSPKSRGGMRNVPSIMMLPVFWIPRFLWPEKPILNFQEWFAREYVGVSHYILIPAMQIGELYLNFGLAGILVGMVVSGILMRFLYLYLISYEKNQMGVFIYTSILPTLWVSLEAAIVSNVTTLLQSLLLLLFIARVLNRGSIFAARRIGDSGNL